MNRIIDVCESLHSVIDAVRASPHPTSYFICELFLVKLSA